MSTLPVLSFYEKLERNFEGMWVGNWGGGGVVDAHNTVTGTGLVRNLQMNRNTVASKN